MRECVQPTKKQGRGKQILTAFTGKDVRTVTGSQPSQGAALEMPSSSNHITLTSKHPTHFCSFSLLIYSQLLSLHSPSPFAPSSSPFVCVLWVNLLFIQGSSWHDRLMLLKLSHSAQVQKRTRNLLKWSHLSSFTLITVNAITVIFLSHKIFQSIALWLCKRFKFK